MEGAGCGDAPNTAHQAAAVGTSGERIVSAGRGLAVGRGRCAFARLLADLSFEQIPNTSEIEAAGAVGEESVVTDAMKAVGQDVQEEAADELMRGNAHDAGAAATTVVFVGE